jgi:hypothetical protein
MRLLGELISATNLNRDNCPLLWLYSSRAYPRIVESIILFR